MPSCILVRWQGRKPFFKHFLILFKPTYGYMVNAICDKECRRHVYGIVQMTEQNHSTKESSCGRKNIEEPFIQSSKNQGHEIRQAGMGREKQIAALRRPPNPIGIVIDRNLCRKGADMGQGHKAGSDDDKEGDAFCCKRYPLRLVKAKHSNNCPKDERPKNKYLVDIKDWYIAQDYIVNIV